MVMKVFLDLKSLVWAVATLTVISMLTSCASTNLQSQRTKSANLAIKAGWIRTALDAGNFSLIGFTPANANPSDVLTVYIEGDGLAWIDSSTPSFDPTPLNPVALRLALRDPNTAVAYLARPCQYTAENERKNCNSRYWTSHRFAPEVIEATNLAVDQLMAHQGAKLVRLIGYSGGGAVAALVAARRHDVDMLITVAGNLDPALWTKTQAISPMSESLNPADYWKELQDIPQQHYVGSHDTNIDASITTSYISRFHDALPSMTVMPSFTHDCCWEQVWPTLVNQYFGLPTLAIH